MKKLIAVLSALVILSLAGAVLAETQLIGVPNDGTNLSRAIKLLEAAGFIEVDPAAGYTPELKDVTKYLYDIEISPVAANTLTSTLDDYAGATINGTYSISFGLNPNTDGLIIEKQNEGEDNPYVNVIVARTAEKDNEIYKKIVEVYQTQAVAEYTLVDGKYASFPAFPYDAENISLTEADLPAIIAYESPREGKQVVRVGVCGSKHDSWKLIQRLLDEQNAGIYIEIVEFDAYNLPNEALNSGDIDLNAFQHKAYLANDCAANGYDLTPIGDTAIAPLTLYSKKFDSVDAIKEAAGKLE